MDRHDILRPLEMSRPLTHQPVATTTPTVDLNPCVPRSPTSMLPESVGISWEINPIAACRLRPTRSRLTLLTTDPVAPSFPRATG